MWYERCGSSDKQSFLRQLFVPSLVFAYFSTWIIEALTDIFLKNGGYLAVTEGVLLTSNSPAEAKKFWEDYPDIKDVKVNIALIRNENYHLLAHFNLPKLAWIDNYHFPLERRIAELKKKYPQSKTALHVLENSEKEIEPIKEIQTMLGMNFS